MPAEQRDKIAEMLGDAHPAQNGLIEQLAGSVRDRAAHDHTTQREDWYCMNLFAFMGEGEGAVLRRLLNAEAEIERLTAEVNQLRRPLTDHIGAAVRSFHQRGHEVAMPLELLEYLTGGVETAALTEAEEAPRDRFEVVSSALSGDCEVAEALRCTSCGSITTQAGFDGVGWTLARLDLLADRHRCLPRIEPGGTATTPLDDAPGSARAVCDGTLT